MLADVVRCTMRRNMIFFMVCVVGGIVVTAAALAGRLDVDAIRWLAFGVAITWGVAATAGIVSDDRSSHVLDVWLAKRGSVWRYYLARFGASLVAIALAVAPVGLLFAVALAEDSGYTPMRALRLFILMIVLAWLVAAIVFGLSGVGVRRDGIVALLFIFVSMQVAALMIAYEHPWAAATSAITLPLEALGELSRWSGNTFRAALTVLTYLVAWTSVGTASLAFRPQRLLKD